VRPGSPAPAAVRQRFGERAALALVLLVAALAYARTATFGLVWDDRLLVAQAEAAHRRDGVPGLLRAEYLATGDRGAPGYHRPLALASIWLDARLARALPWSFHLTNVALHALASLLVLLLLRALLPPGGGALFGALLFAVHPAHVESVAFVSARTDLWAGCLVLASTLLWLRERRGPPGGAWLTRALSTLALALAGLAKETALLLPAVLLLWGRLLPEEEGGERPGRRGGALAWIPLWAGALIVVLLLRRLSGVGWAGGGLLPAAGSLPLLAWAAAVKTEHYAKLLLLPWPLNAYYTPDQVAPGWLP
jgi:hypothetical protein